MKNKKYKTSLFAIGTELVTGDVLNTNAQNLSKFFLNLGHDVVSHSSTKDDFQRMMDELTHLSKYSNFFVLTGGLGPTSDDFTKDVVSKFLDLPMEWKEEIWKKIEEKLLSRSVSVVESQKKQAYFPKGAIVFNNPKGTADAFLVENENACFLVLPGPPREIEGILKAGLEDHLRKNYSSLQEESWKIYRCLGVTEAQVAEKTDELFSEFSLQTGFRAHIPYVDIKLLLPVSLGQNQSFQKKLREFESMISESRVPYDLDPCEEWINLLCEKNITELVLHDEGSFGGCSKKIRDALRKKSPDSFHFVSKENHSEPLKNPLPLSTNQKDHSRVFLSIKPSEDAQGWWVEVQTFLESKKIMIKNPYPKWSIRERPSQFLTEKIFHALLSLEMFQR